MKKATRRNALKLAAVGVALTGAEAVAAQREKSPTTEHHDIKLLEARIKDLRRSLLDLADDKTFEELLLLIRRPGYTRPAEFKLVIGVIESMHAQAKTLAGLKQLVLDASRMIIAG